MRISEIVEKIRDDKTTPGRFPSRVILVRNWDDYTTLVTELRNVCDITLNLSEFTTGDIVPRFKSLKAKLAENANKTILLLSFGEYLRLCAKREPLGLRVGRGVGARPAIRQAAAGRRLPHRHGRSKGTA